MSMILILESVTEDVEAAVAAVPAMEAGEPTLKLFDGSFDEEDSEDFDDFDTFEEEDSLASSSMTLEKAWHGLHFLLTGTSWEGTGRRAFLLNGGNEVGSDEGYGPSRLYSAADVIEIARELESVDGEALWSNFDQEKMTDEEIYPDIWDEEEEELKEEYLEYFEELCEFVSTAASNGEGIRITLT